MLAFAPYSLRKGCGISAEQQSIIFNKFTQANTSIRRDYGGSGLGLSIVRKLVLAMNGTIKVESEVGQGSTFSVWLPGFVRPANSAAKASPVERVLLYEEATTGADENGSTGIVHAIEATGRKPRRVSNLGELKTALESFRPNAVVVAKLPIRKQETGSESSLHQVLEASCDANSDMVVIAVGNALDSSSRTSNGGEKFARLSVFPTSDEFEDVFVSTQKSRPNLQERIAGLCLARQGDPWRVLLAEDVCFLFCFMLPRALHVDLTIELQSFLSRQFGAPLFQNLINQKVMIKLLSRLPCDLRVACNGVEAVELASKNKWNVILMDMVMPEMDGIEATVRIRETDQLTPIIALTANATTTDRDKCLKSGMNDFISKPVSFEALCCIFDRLGSSRGDGECVS
jgi:two-component system, sensor histidine kinase and response regulator